MQRFWSRALLVLTIGLGVGCKRGDAHGDGHESKGHAEHGKEHAEHGKEHAEHGKEHAEHGKEHEGHDDLPRQLKLEQRVIEQAGIKTAKAEREVLAEVLNLPGEVAADPDRVARISTPAAGRLEEVRFREGGVVKKGDVLAVIRVPEIAKVRATFSATEARAKAMRSNAQRLRALHKEGVGLEQDAVNAESEADALEQETRSTADLLGALGAGKGGAASVTLRAALGGTVVARDAVVGQPVSAEQSLGTIVDLSEVWFLARVFEKDLRELAPGVSAEVHLNAYPDEHFAGIVEYVGQQIDAVARTVTARVRLKNRNDLLRVGLFGTSQIAIGRKAAQEARLVVAQSSITEIGGKKVVFVQESSGEFNLHEVTLGRESLGKTEILAGLREGEVVVTSGAFTLKSILLKGSFAEGHH
jgi:cobalt-zinc-cadmium efflux system membrane fusion protein